MQRIIYFIVFLLLPIWLSCHVQTNANLVSKWQSLNDPNFVIEFAPDSIFKVYRDGKDLLSSLQPPVLHYEIELQNSGWYNFSTRDTNGESDIYFGRIEVVNEDRIRIYLHKHHDILDLADEYHRTKDLNSYDSIMSTITSAPDKSR